MTGAPSASSSRLWQQARLARVLVPRYLSLSAQCDYVSAGSVVGGSMSEGGGDKSSGVPRPARRAMIVQWGLVVQWGLLICAVIGTAIATLTYISRKEPSETNNQVRPDASLAGGEISITSPRLGATVCRVQRVSGTLSPLPSGGDDKVWIVINPMGTPGNFFVQSPLTAQKNWAGFVNFGEAGQQHVGLSYQFRAFFGPGLRLPVGAMGGWPANASTSSRVVEVKRGDC